MPKIYILRGIPASGKSTKAIEIVSNSPKDTVRYNWDSLRIMMGGEDNYWVLERENLGYLKIDRDNFFKFYMSKGWNIVCDNMNLNPKDMAYYKDIIEGTDYTLEIINCFTPVEECIRRDSMRSNPIGEKTIKDIWKRYRHQIIQEEQREYSKQFLKEYDFNKKNCIVVDLDATTALALSGRPFFGKGCSELIHQDIPITPTIHIIENFHGEVIFLTGRNEDCREETVKWIDNNIKFNGYENYTLIMRDDNDYSSGADFKVKKVKEEILPYFNIEFILEDSNKVVEAFRKMNLFVFQPINGTY